MLDESNFRLSNQKCFRTFHCHIRIRMNVNETATANNKNHMILKYFWMTEEVHLAIIKQINSCVLLLYIQVFTKQKPHDEQ